MSAGPPTDSPDATDEAAEAGDLADLDLDSLDAPSRRAFLERLLTVLSREAEDSPTAVRWPDELQRVRAGTRAPEVERDREAAEPEEGA